MRIAIITILALASLACSKKDAAAPAEPEEATETPSPDAEGAAEEGAKEGIPEALSKDLNNIEVTALPEQLQGETPALDAAPTITVIEPGAEPRTALRLSVAPGFKQSATIEIGYTLEASVIMIGIRNPHYGVTFDLSMRTKKAKADGSVRVSYQVESATLDSSKQGQPKRVAMLERALKGVKTLSGSYTLTSRGQITNSTVEVAKGAVQESHDIADNLRVALHQITPALPEEPVGKGATWTVHEGIMQGGVHVNQLRSFELVDLENGIATIEVELEQAAAPQPYETPGKPIPLELRVLSGEGEATLAWDLSKLTPARADGESTVLSGIRQTIQKDGRPQSADSATRSIRTIDIGTAE